MLSLKWFFLSPSWYYPIISSFKVHVVFSVTVLNRYTVFVSYILQANSFWRVFIIITNRILDGTTHLILVLFLPWVIMDHFLGHATLVNTCNYMPGPFFTLGYYEPLPWSRHISEYLQLHEQWPYPCTPMFQGSFNFKGCPWRSLSIHAWDPGSSESPNHVGHIIIYGHFLAWCHSVTRRRRSSLLHRRHQLGNHLQLSWRWYKACTCSSLVTK